MNQEIQVINLDPHLKYEIMNRSDENIREKSKFEHLVMQNESIANVTNSIIDINDYMVTQQDALISKDIKLKNYYSTINHRYICYELEKEHLVIVEKISENQLTYSLKICKNDNIVMIEKTKLLMEKYSESAEIGIENLVNLEFNNQLSILKNILTRLNMSEENHYCLINDIFILIVKREFSKNKQFQKQFESLKFYFFDWIDLKLNVNKNHLFLIKNNDLIADDQLPTTTNVLMKNHNVLYLIKEVIKYKNLNLFYKVNYTITNIFKLLDLMKFDCFFVVKFDCVNQDIRFSFFPIFPQFPLYNFSRNYDLDPMEVHAIKSYADAESLFLINNKDFCNNLINETICENYALIKGIIEILKRHGLINYMKTVISLLMVQYIFSNFKFLMTNKKLRVFAEFRSLINSLEDFTKIENAAGFIAHLFLLLVFQFLEDVINKELHIFLNNQNKNLINLGAFIDNNSGDSLDTLNSLIFEKVNNQMESDKSNSLISSFIEKNNKNFYNKVNINNMDYLNFFRKIIDFSQIIKFYNLNLKKCFVYEICEIFLAKTNEIQYNESDKILVKQIWISNIEEKCLFNKFPEEKDIMLEQIKEKRIQEYIDIYKNTFFCEYTTVDFINSYYAIIDCKEKFDRKKINYIDSIHSFFIQLNEKEGLNEKFIVNKEKVMFNYVFYCLLANCKKHIIEEKTLIFQKYFRRFKVRNLLKKYVEKVKFIQKKWKEHFYIKSDNFDKHYKYLIRTTITKDPLISKLFYLLKSKYTQVNNENLELLKELENLKKENIFYKRNSFNYKDLKPNDLIIKREEANYSDMKSSNASLSVRSKDSNNLLNHLNKSALVTNHPQISIHTAKGNITEISDSYQTNKLKENYKIEELEKKLENYKGRYTKVLKVVKEHEEKFAKLISIINSKKEIKAVLSKYGVLIK